MKKMTQYILKEKLLFPIIFTLTWAILQVATGPNDWSFKIIWALVLFIIISLFTFSKNDNYIQKPVIENETISIQYQENFLKAQPKIFTTNAKSIENFKFSSSSFLGLSYSITINFIDESNLYDKITFQTNNETFFIDLIYQLKEIKTKSSTASTTS
ncbi:MAG: hypothetical protein CL526_09430 [Aequorivita sp.]|nr:hypothetical protein [Aequorivita sp.]|tara:strand:+ start:9071 stop:9541 length:471 start_codon:yes stop_codon:yes gene_type:complete